MRASKVFAAVLFCLVPLITWGCGDETAPEPVPAGQRTEEPRLVVLSPAIGVMCRDLGLEDHVVGRHDYDLALSDSIPKVGNQMSIDYERLLEVEPTHVITQWGTRALPPKLLELSQQRGFDLIDYDLLTLDDIARVADDLYLDFVEPPSEVGFEPGEDGAPMPRFRGPEEQMPANLPSERMARAWRQRGDGFKEIGPVLLLGAVEPPTVVGPGSFHHQILERLGGVPALRDGSPWTELDAEDVLRLEPAAMVLIDPRPPGTPPRQRSMQEVRDRLGVLTELDVPAVRRDRLAVIDQPFALLPSTSMIDFADRLAELLEGWKAQAEASTP